MIHETTAQTFSEALRKFSGRVYIQIPSRTAMAPEAMASHDANGTWPIIVGDYHRRHVEILDVLIDGALAECL